MRKNNKGISSNVITIIIIVLAAIVGLVLAFVNSGKNDRSIKDTESYKTQSFSGLSLDVPKVFEDMTNTYRSEYSDVLAWYECDDAFVAVYSEKIPSLDGATLDDLSKLIGNMTFDGQKYTPVNKGDYLLIEYKQTFRESNSGKKEDGYYIDAFYIKGDTFYTVEAACLADKYYDYKEYMMKWVESFKY